MPNYHTPLLPGELYHVFNHAVGTEQLFRQDTNYNYFLQRYRYHISPAAETLAWCLLPNHFHFLVRIKSAAALRQLYAIRKQKLCADEALLSDFIMEQFSNWQNGYAKAYNKMYSRKGALFIDYIRRVQLNKEHQFGRTVLYVHWNPVRHGFTDACGRWPWTSYSEYANNQFAVVDSREVVDWFGSVDGFLKFHAGNS